MNPQTRSSGELVLSAGNIKRIHVDQHTIRRNVKTGGADPPISVKLSRGNHKAHVVEIFGPSTVVYSPNKPLGCGARVWVETRAPVALRGSYPDEPSRLA